VPTVLLDEQMAGDVAILRSIAESDDWKSVSDQLALQFATFVDVGLATGTTDRLVWEYCQDNGYFLLTDNRNDDAGDSLEATIRNQSTAASLPVFNVGDRLRFQCDRDYALQVFERLLEYLMDADNLLGTGRHYLP